MTGPIIQLSTDELWSAVEGIDLVGVLAEELVARTTGDLGRGRQRIVRRTPRENDVGRVTDQVQDRVVFQDRRTGARCALPCFGLRIVRVAGLVALSARRLLAPGIVTAVVMASGTAAELHTSVIARYVPGVSHIAIWTEDSPAHRSVGPRLLDQLDLAGIGLSVTAQVDDAVRGANLVTVARPETEGVNFSQLAKGALVVNCLGTELPKDIVAGVNQIYVDDVGLLRDNPHQHFTTLYPAGLDHHTAQMRQQQDRDRVRPIEVDLAQLATRTHAGRINVGDILLMELLSVNELSTNWPTDFTRPH